MQIIDYGTFEGTLNFNVSARNIDIGSEANLETFTYSLDESTEIITLTKYANGIKSKVVVYGKYEVDGKVYNTEITGGVVANSGGAGNDVITCIVFKL